MLHNLQRARRQLNLWLVQPKRLHLQLPKQHNKPVVRLQRKQVRSLQLAQRKLQQRQLQTQHHKSQAQRQRKRLQLQLQLQLQTRLSKPQIHRQFRRVRHK
jgi:hypothetical protein